MWPPQAKFALREALALGCDEGILLSDRAFAGADTWATATTLVGAIRTLGPIDLILCGGRATDGETRTGRSHGGRDARLARVDLCIDAGRLR